MHAAECANENKQGYRFLAEDELDMVAGGAGEVQISSSPVLGGLLWTATCGPGYSISTSLNLNSPTGNLSDWTNPANYSCTPGTSGIEWISFLSQGSYVFDFYSYPYSSS